MDPVHAALDHWRTGNALKAGEILFERLPASHRPRWAADVLAVCCSALDVVPAQVADLLEIARSAERWSEGHRAFDALRDEVLLVEHGHRTLPRLTFQLLFVAENVARVVYNAGEPSDPFDRDGGWWVVATARAMVDQTGDRDFESRVWAALVGPVRE